MLETTLSIPQFFNQLSQHHSVDRGFADQPVVPHTIVDDFLPEHLFDAVTTELETFPEERWITKQLKNSGVRKESRDFVDTPSVQSMMTELTAHSFLTWMSSVTNFDDIIPDPHHLGAGASSAPSGAYLGLHVDFNWNNTLRLSRKVNLIYYANREWQSDWNGQLEFWTRDKKDMLLSIEPKPNRLVFWEFEQNYLHGFSKPLECPQDVARNNLMTVYYSSNATPTSQPHKSLFE